MTSDTTTASDLYRGWDAYQERLIALIAPLAPEQLAFRTASHLRTVGENSLHIIGARARWCKFVLALEDESLADFGRWDDEGAPERTGAELAEALRSSWQVLSTALASWTVADLAHTIPNTDPGPDEPDVYTRQWVLWHLIEHDLHHGGEVSQILGSFGVPGLDL